MRLPLGYTADSVLQVYIPFDSGEYLCIVGAMNGAV